MVADENEDRKILFKAMSSKTGGSVDEVANKFSKALVQKVRKDIGFGNLPENGCKESKLSAFISSG